MVIRKYISTIQIFFFIKNTDSQTSLIVLGLTWVWIHSTNSQTKGDIKHSSLHY